MLLRQAVRADFPMCIWHHEFVWIVYLLCHVLWFSRVEEMGGFMAPRVVVFTMGVGIIFFFDA